MFEGKKYFYEDLSIGQEFDLGSATLSKQEIIEFAQKYDPQLFHLNEEAGKFVFGGLAASGWQTASLCQGMLVRHFLNDAACLGSPGVENLNFLKPVFADQTLKGRGRIIEMRPSTSNPKKGLVKIQGEVLNPADEPVLSLTGLLMMARRAEA